jgi:hypothetical protein
MKEMGDFVKKIWAEKDPEKKKGLVEEFKTKFADYLDAMIDPDHPDLGPKNNQIVLMWGRLKGGRSDLLHRFFGSGLGTVNRHGHTTVCQGSLYFGLQGDVRAVCGRQVLRRRQVLLAGGPGQQRVHHLRGGQPL